MDVWERFRLEPGYEGHPSSNQHRIGFPRAIFVEESIFWTANLVYCHVSDTRRSHVIPLQKSPCKSLQIRMIGCMRRRSMLNPSNTLEERRWFVGCGMRWKMQRKATGVQSQGYIGMLATINMEGKQLLTLEIRWTCSNAHRRSSTLTTTNHPPYQPTNQQHKETTRQQHKISPLQENNTTL